MKFLHEYAVVCTSLIVGSRERARGLLKGFQQKSIGFYKLAFHYITVGVSPIARSYVGDFEFSFLPERPRGSPAPALGKSAITFLCSRFKKI